MELNIYHCSHCGNVAVKLVDVGVPMKCCGQKMEKLVPNITDAASEKHVPVITRNGSNVTIKVGSIEHPMLDEHYINFIAAISGDKIVVKYQKPGNSSSLSIESSEPITAYGYCNLHGLWMSKE